MRREITLNLLLSTVAAITAILAIAQTHKQIKLSNKQFLFDKRLDKYLLANSLIELYKEHMKSLDYSNEKDDEPIIVDIQFINLTNIEHLKDITCIIEDPKNNEYKNNFLIKMEELKKLSKEINFIFPDKSKKYLSNFVLNYQNVLIELYKYQIVFNNMRNDKIPREKKPGFKELQKDYGELRHRKRLYEAINNLESSYKVLIDNKVISKIEKSIKL